MYTKCDVSKWRLAVIAVLGTWCREIICLSNGARFRDCSLVAGSHSKDTQGTRSGNLLLPEEYPCYQAIENIQGNKAIEVL